MSCRRGWRRSYRVLGGGVAVDRGRGFVVFFPGVAAGAGCSSSGYFFVLGQTRRHGWCFTVSVRSLMFVPLAFSSGPRLLTSSITPFNFSDDWRKFWSVILMLSLLDRSVLIFSMLASAIESELSRAVRLVRFSTKVRNCASPMLSCEFSSVIRLRFCAVV